MQTTISALHITAVLCFLIAGCGGSQVQISKPSPTVQPLHSESLDVRNCETTKELHKSLSDFLPVRKEVSVPQKANTIGSGQSLDIPEAKCSDLVDKVERAYQQEYRQARAGLQKAEINVPADKIYMYQIQWQEKTYRGTITFQFDDQRYEVPYTYKLEVPEIDSSKQMNCTA